MGTIIELAIGRLEVDWGKNEHFIHHGELFQNCDLKKIQSHYYDADDCDLEVSPTSGEQEGFGKPLNKLPRSKLTGY